MTETELQAALDQPLPELPCGLSYGWEVPEPETDLADLWLRWPANDILPVRITSPEPLHYRAHWYTAARVYRRCTAPRDLRAPNPCRFCPRPSSQGKPIAGPALTRHILTVELPCREQRIWEFSEAVAKQLRDLTGYQKTRDGRCTREVPLHGLRLLLSRHPPRLNGALLVIPDPDPDDRGDLPDPMDAAGYLSQTWARAALKDGKAPPPLFGK